MTAGLIATGIVLAFVALIGAAVNGWKGIFQAWAILIGLYAVIWLWDVAQQDEVECDLSNYAGEVYCYDGP